MTLQRYKLTVAYRGTRYHGWQQQPALPTYKGEREPGAGVAPFGPPRPDSRATPEQIPTIQGELKKAIADVVGHPVDVVGSSRTDAGVHAKGQVVHFDTDKAQIPQEGLRRAVNHRLPGDILIRSIEAVPPTFDAIASTQAKRYQFLIWNHRDRPLFFSDLAWHRWHYLDVPKIIEAARHLVGEHDFASFARPGHGRENTVRTVHACDVSYRAPRLVVGVEGSGFLWNMVRIIVGTLVQVGIGRTGPDEIPAILAARDRRSAGPTAPPHGLYLQWVRRDADPETTARRLARYRVADAAQRHVVDPTLAPADARDRYDDAGDDVE
jgi:tRNA pseudouridine38-40 synthase